MAVKLDMSKPYNRAEWLFSQTCNGKKRVLAIETYYGMYHISFLLNTYQWGVPR